MTHETQNTASGTGESKKYDYLAFISYSREDKRIANWLEKELIKYPFPIEKVDPANYPPDKDSGCLRPIFRDKTGLNPNNPDFKKEIETKIKASRFLIVLCSPNSAASSWVSKEAKIFIRNRPDYQQCLIPVVLDGSPNLGRKRQKAECFPRIMRVVGKELTQRTLPTMVPDDDDPAHRDEARKRGLVQTISWMLKVDFSALWNIYQEQQILEQKKQIRAQRLWIVAISVFLLVSAVLTSWAFHERFKAEAAEKLAVEHRNAAEELVGFMTFDMRDEIFQHIPSAAREAINEKVSQYFEKWEAANPNWPAAHYDNLGGEAKATGDLEKAKRFYQQSLSIRRGLVNNEPDNLLRRWTLSISLNNVGGVLQRQGDTTGAREYYEESLEIMRYLVGVDKNQKSNTT